MSRGGPLVNFSNHLDKDRPFDGLYEMPMEAFTARWGRIVNGLRLPDLQDAFDGAGLHLNVVPFGTAPEALPACIDPTWLSRYDRETLTIRTALFTNLPVIQPTGATSPN